MVEIQLMKIQVVVHSSSTIIEHTSNICPIRACIFCCRSYISKDRARQVSDVANELVFLHDALPGVQKYYEAQNVQNVLY